MPDFKKFYTPFEWQMYEDLVNLYDEAGINDGENRSKPCVNYLLPAELIEGLRCDLKSQFLETCEKESKACPFLNLGWKASAFMGIYWRRSRLPNKFAEISDPSDISQDSETFRMLGRGNTGLYENLHEWTDSITDIDSAHLYDPGSYSDLYPFDIENMCRFESYLFHGDIDSELIGGVIQCYVIPPYPGDDSDGIHFNMEKIGISEKKFETLRNHYYEFTIAMEYDKNLRFPICNIETLRKRSCTFGVIDCDCSKLTTKKGIMESAKIRMPYRQDIFYRALFMAMAYESARMKYVKAIVLSMDAKGLGMFRGISSLIIENFIPEYKNLRRWAQMFVTRPNSVDRAKMLDRLLYGIEREYPLR